MNDLWVLYLEKTKGFGSYIIDQILGQSSPNYFWWLTGVSLVVWIGEMLFPWRKHQSIFRKDFWVDFFYMYFNFYIFNLVIFIAFKAFAGQQFSLLGIQPLFSFKSWPDWAQLLVFFIATDFIQWVTHRLLHRFDFLWEFHKVHHSVEQMGFAAHLRFHWMETVVYTPMKYIVVMLIGGFEPELAYIVHFFAITIGHINHANMKISYGPLKYLLNNPMMHIWHHAKGLPKEKRYGVNFGITLSIWDYLFRTYYIPRSGKDISLGFEDIDTFPTSIWKQILYPFYKK